MKVEVSQLTFNNLCELIYTALGEAIAFIEAQRALNAMSEDRARMHLEMQKNTASSVLLTLEGLSALAVEVAINAALDVVRGTVNTAVGFVLI